MADWLTLADWAITASQMAMGEAVVYEGQTIRAPFDDAFEVVEPLSGDLVTGVQPMLAVRLADLASPPKIGDKYQVRGSWYEVVDVQNDGHGAARLMSVETAPPVQIQI